MNDLGSLRQRVSALDSRIKQPLTPDQCLAKAAKCDLKARQARDRDVLRQCVVNAAEYDLKAYQARDRDVSHQYQEWRRLATLLSELLSEK